MVGIQLLAICFALFPLPRTTYAQETVALTVKKAAIGDGIQLSYIESGSGVPVIFIHGTLGDLHMWTSFVEAFGKDYRAIAYSRRYNFPNGNEIKPGADHSTAVEARDLAKFISALNLPKSHIVGYSYGGYTALHLAVDHPELVRSLVLAEPPLLPWLADMEENHEEGKRMLRLQQTQFVDPARKAIESGKETKAIQIFIDYVIRDGAFETMPDPDRRVLLRNAPEFVAEVTSKNMFAPLSRKDVASLPMPTLMISGEKSIGPLKLTDAELEKTLPSASRVRIRDATHGMWYENPTECKTALADFFRAN